ncbi:MAG: D-glycero-beta-D-manno-heptose 1,7-bisphosphate 7-phosphatase [Proteobacteria bacterium]|nr:D-glycero-beta-D-manno-heptose 1,7-bisphosphate 7-phosphatase [Pseudomonadota bacterium]NOG60990.1 D-glycero-beta-D-manno-heptose 1,7-bisphosphate 7-phosphatase [Pseudomonadota bacterium]
MALIILDRDGVINEDSDDYIKSPEEWHAIPGSLEAISTLSHNGYQVIIATNQSGIGRKLFTMDDLNAIHLKMKSHLAQYGGVIDAIFFCPHTPRDDCNCRKPKPGLYNDISQRLRIALNKVYCIGDKMTDVKAIQSAGGKPVLVRTGKGQSEIDQGLVPEGIPVYDNLASFVNEKIIFNK